MGQTLSIGDILVDETGQYKFTVAEACINSKNTKVLREFTSNKDYNNTPHLYFRIVRETRDSWRILSAFTQICKIINTGSIWTSGTAYMSSPDTSTNRDGLILRKLK